MTALAGAEPIARDNGLMPELTELHYLRGNLHFARGETELCRAEHAKAHEGAIQMADHAWEARALSGLADADYLQGAMRTACERFTRCVALCDSHGLVRFAIPNRVMVGHCRIYLNEFDAGMQDMRAAHDAAVRLSNRHAQMFATQSTGLLLISCGRLEEALPHLEESLLQAQALGARRYEAVILGHLAESHSLLGKAPDAQRVLAQALLLARETGMGFCGPMILGLLGYLSEDAATRDLAYAEAETLLAAGCGGHNYFHYYRCAIADALARGEWAGMLRHAEGLATFTRHEPLPYSDFLIRRARVLAALAHAPHDPAAQGELDTLRVLAERLDWRIGWPAWAQPADARPTT
jgi:tetratricopeptide (TPR) repeat protein